MLDTLHFEVAMLEAVDFGWKERGNEDKLAQVNWNTIFGTEIVLKCSLGWINPISCLYLRRVQISQSIRPCLEVILNDHLIVDFILRLHQLGLSLVYLQMEHVDILRLREIPIQVLVYHFDRIIYQVTVRRVADSFLWIKF